MISWVIEVVWLLLWHKDLRAVLVVLVLVQETIGFDLADFFVLLLVHLLAYRGGRLMHEPRLSIRSHLDSVVGLSSIAIVPLLNILEGLWVVHRLLSNHDVNVEESLLILG